MNICRLSFFLDLYQLPPQQIYFLQIFDENTPPKNEYQNIVALFK